MPLPSLNHDQWKPESSCTNDCTKIPKWSKMIQNVQWCAVMEWSKLPLILLPEVWQNPAWSRMRGSRLFLEFGQPLVHLLHLRGCRRYLWRIRCRCTLGDWLEWLRVLWALLGQSLQLFSKCCNVLPRACWLRHFLHARCHLWMQRRNSRIRFRLHVQQHATGCNLDTRWVGYWHQCNILN